MPMSSARACAPVHPSAPAGARSKPSASKVARERLARLEVEAGPCPQVLLRVLGLLAQRWVTPLAIAATCGDDRIALAVDIEAPSPEQAEALIARIEAVVMVRSARLT